MLTGMNLLLPISESTKGHPHHGDPEARAWFAPGLASPSPCSTPNKLIGMKSDMNESNDLASRLDQSLNVLPAVPSMRCPVDFQTGIAPHANGSRTLFLWQHPGDLLSDD